MNEFGKRLDRIMKIQGIRAVDIVYRANLIAKQNGLSTKITKQNMSNYLLGRSTPNSGKLQLLSKALNVEPSYFTTIAIENSSEDLTPLEKNLIQCWRIASPKDKDMISFILADYGFVYDEK